ncbi:MAG: metalloregulator ArsR/SmtB family transcription factor [Candidatus Bathyarchaeia archaeon]|nr:winged helix-turn-helix transcriptional regulator [Candidatus Bathyarchaeota archaeon]
MRENLNKFRAKIFRALADPTRLEILEILRDGEKCVCEIIPLLGQPQPIVSRNLSILRRTGLVKVRKQGNRRLYSVTSSSIYHLIDPITIDLVNVLTKYALEHLV